MSVIDSDTGKESGRTRAGVLRSGPRGRRFFLPIGIGRPGGLFRDLPAVPRDLARMRKTFGDLGYLDGPTLNNPSAGAVRTTIQDWLLRTHLDRQDAVVIYYSGHGLVWGGNHYLVTNGFDKDEAGTTGFRSDELLGLIVNRKARPEKVWLILDCCQAGGVLTDGLRGGLLAAEAGAFVLAVSGSWGQAVDGAFTAAFNRVLHGRSQPASCGGAALSLDQLAHNLNARGLGSRVVQAGISSSRFDLLERRRHRSDRSRRRAIATIFPRRANR